MENENSLGDPELDAMVFGEEPGTGTPPQANPSEKQEWEAGGRKWDSPEKLAKAYDSLLKDYSKTKNEYKTAKPWGDFGKFVQSNPKLGERFQKALDEYNAERQAGATPAQAAKEAGIPREYAEKIERLEAAHADLQLDREISALQTKYKLSPEEVKEVLQFSAENDGLDLEKSYKLQKYEANLAKAREDGLKGAQENLAKKKAANVGPSAHPSVSPSPKPAGRMNEIESRNKLSKRLEGFGIADD